MSFDPIMSVRSLTSNERLRVQLFFVMIATMAACSSSDSGPVDSPLGNRPPNVTGLPPPNAMLDLVYSFRPAGSDPDGDILTFSIANKPVWATFDSISGLLTGVPSIQHIGTYENIEISVSDGLNAVKMPAFNLEVVASATGSLSLSWTPPTRNTDGTLLSDLASYRIRWGTQSGDHPNFRPVSNSGLSRFVIDGLAGGNYFFIISAVDTSNNESQASNEASGTVP